MGWFSPVKGPYPSLAQVDKALPVAEGSSSIKRGTIVALVKDSTGKSAEGVFKVAGATDKILYASLQDYNDPTAGFAGTSFDPTGGVPKINGIDLGQDGEYETSVFDTNQTYNVGDSLYVNNGVLTSSGSAGYTVVGVVTAPPDERWVNNAIAVPSQENGPTDPRTAIRTGANLSVLRFKTV